MGIGALVYLIASSSVLPRGAVHTRAALPLRIGGTLLVVAIIVLWIARFAGRFGGPAPI
ncbi:MAG: hypothetical protein NVS3B20_16940 [Polyangiales bacterium]